MRMLLCWLFLTAGLAAQSRPPVVEVKPVFGAVTGTVTCSDTNLPARLTQLTLQPVAVPKVLRGGKQETQDSRLDLYRTGLDGTFTMDHVKAGTYYVVVLKPGYLSPVALFTKDEIETPSEEVKAAIAKSVPTITIDANRTTAVDIRLQRAATLTGVIRYDDGTPVSQQYVEVQRRGADGKWISTHMGRAAGPTDDQGRYRISGVPAGTYRMFTRLQVEDYQTDAVFGNGSSSASRDKFNLNVYFGDTFWKTDAKVYKLEDGQELTENLTIPNSLLHAVSGTLVDRSGRSINAGTVRLYRDGVEVVSVEIQDDEPVFRLAFVPEGAYTVKVTDARDVTRVPFTLPEGAFGMGRGKETVVKTYGVYEGALTVSGDRTGLVLAMPSK